MLNAHETPEPAPRFAIGTTFPTPTPDVLEFSPDGSVVYSWEPTTGTISILGFNASTAAITSGGSIYGFKRRHHIAGRKTLRLLA